MVEGAEAVADGGVDSAPGKGSPVATSGNAADAPTERRRLS
jgi:hypothetical protein